MNKVGKEDYFAKEAAMYNTRLDRGFLGVIRRAERRVVLELLDPKKGESILDIPCGSGYYAKFIQQRGANVYGLDVSEEMIKVFRKNGYAGEKGNLENFSLNKTFDKVLSAGGFEFCKNHGVIVQNLKSHVKKNGLIVILLPRKNFFGYLYKYYHKVYNKTNIILFSKNDVENICEQEIIKISDIKKSSLFSYVIKLEEKS